VAPAQNPLAWIVLVIGAFLAACGSTNLISEAFLGSYFDGAAPSVCMNLTKISVACALCL
jgi:hypothetical protein